MSDVSLIFYIVWFASIFIGAYIGGKKGKKKKAWLLTGFLGVIGLIIVIFMKPSEEAEEKAKIASGNMKKCPHCAELIQSEAKICKHCNKSVEETV